jgi:hypothetical protein
VMNIVSVVLFTLYVKRKTDTITATIFFSFYILALQSIIQARWIWQPYPVPLCISAALLVVPTSEKRPSYWRLFWSIALFTIGFTIYPGAVLLLPMFLFQWSSVYIHKFHNIVKAWGAAILSFGMIVLVASTSWIVHEFKNNFPTVHAVIHSSNENLSQFVFRDNAQGIMQRMALHGTALYRLIIPQFYLNPYLWRYQNIVDASFLIVLGLLIVILYRVNLFKKFLTFLSSVGFVYIVLGIIPLVFFNTLKNSQHHVLVLLPFFLLIISYIVRLTITSPNVLIKMISALLVIIFYVANFSFDLPCSNCLQSYKNVIELYSFLMRDVQSRSQPLRSYDFKIVTSSDEYDYETQPLWYFLKKYHNYPVLFTEDGNDTSRYGSTVTNRHYAYLICYPRLFSRDKCWDMFALNNSQTTIIKHVETGLYSIYLVKQ